MAKASIVSSIAQSSPKPYALKPQKASAKALGSRAGASPIRQAMAGSSHPRLSSDHPEVVKVKPAHRLTDDGISKDAHFLHNLHN